jgi:hypothetical protein
MMPKKPLPAKYTAYDPADYTTDDDLYEYAKASPWKRKMMLRAAWKEEAQAKKKEGV